MLKTSYRPFVLSFFLFMLACLLKLLIKDRSLSWIFLNNLFAGKRAALYIFYQLRLPALIAYVACAFLVVLATYILQTISQNDLADPSALGYHNVALLFLVLMTLYLPSLQHLTFYMALIVTGCLVLLYSFFMYWFASDQQQRLDGNLLLLIGMGMNLVFQMALSYLKTYASQLSDIVSGLMSGNFDHLSLSMSIWLFLLSVLVLGVFFLMSPSIRLLQLGEILASSMGLRVKLQTFLLFVLMSFALALCVMFGSSFPFVGFTALYIMRHFYGTSFHLHLISSCFCAGSIIIFSDIIAHEFFSTILPTNIFFGLFGGVGFLLILLQSRRQTWE